jgi:tetratricopeptide (TPR) repeat protein
MIDILKSRYKIGDSVTLHTLDASFTGIIDAIEDSCVILSTDEGEEIIANDTIKRISIPKTTNTDKKEYIKESDVKQEVIKPIIHEDLKTEKAPLVSHNIEYKAGDKIPLEELETRIDKKNITKSHRIKGSGIVLDSLSDLKRLILPEIETENKKFISATGLIHTYWEDRKYGFITDFWKNNIYFHYSDIIDKELLSSLNGYGKNENIAVIFSLRNVAKGKKAIYIQKPKTVEQVAELAKQYFENENKFDTALGLVDQILFCFPENYTAIKLKEEIEEKRHKQYKTIFKNYDINYQKAIKAKNSDKNYEEALKLYLKAFENNEKRESCIKDIGMLYVSMGEINKAIEFMDKYENELPNSITTYNYLENFYGSVKCFEKVIEYTELLLEEKSVVTDRRKNSMYLSKMGFALIQLDKLDDARDVLDEAIGIHPENLYARRLLQALDEPYSDELSQIKEADFDSLGAGGISDFIKSTLNNYSEYYGVPPKIKDKGDFSKETLNSIRNLIDTAGRARPSERANYLLTEAKLLEQLEPDNNNDLKSVLARFCNAMALNSIYEKYSLDVVRTFYIEAFQLEDNWDSIRRQFTLYLISLSNNHQELINQNSELSGKEISNQKFIDVVVSALNTDRVDCWENILLAFRINPTLANKSLKFIYDNEVVRKKSLEFLGQIGYINLKIVDFDSYSDCWQKAREKRQREYTTWLASLKAISNNTTIEILTNLLLDSLNEVRKSWLTQLDTSRLNIIAGDIYDTLVSYLRQSGYRDKERSFNLAKAQINQLITEIKEKPTKFSYEGFIPLLEKIEILLEKSFKKVEEASSPKVKITILGEASVVGNDNIVSVQITVENSKDSSPIRDVKVEINNSDDIRFIPRSNIYYDSIDGGEYYIFKLNVQISEKIINDKAATIDVCCDYKTRNQEEPIIITEQLSLRLYSEDEFEPIENPYAPIADGGPVTDKGMFYGRDEFINNRINAILNADSKQIIIYGQKRSGKSSVLHHLKQGLEATNKTFCVLFSLGEIIRDLNEYTFYHKIIYGISRNLRLIKAIGSSVPEFSCPTEEEFKTKYPSNPANGFIELIEDFLFSCSKLDSWKNKKLVVMIDEFTYLYTAIRNGSTSETIMKQWKAITQNENAKFSVVLVGQDVVPSFKKEDYAKNAFGVIEDIRLTYLDIEDARKLIEEPILNKNNESRFIRRAVDTIIDYTSRNPYYIQIFCSRLVDYMNAKKIIRITEADIKEIAETFIEGSHALAPEKFDNLIRAGEEHDFVEFDDEPIIKILRQIAIGSKNIGVCSRDNITLNDRDFEDKILNHLVDREVLERKKGDNYKIQVKLFQEWLLRH